MYQVPYGSLAQEYPKKQVQLLNIDAQLGSIIPMV